jgi:rod shape-determining protein MreD
MRTFLAVLLSALALLGAPIVEQACGDRSFRPDLMLAPLVICVSLCPGGPAVLCCGVLGLILDCLAGRHLGARAACFCLLAAVGSVTTGRREESWARRYLGWWTLLFLAGALSQLITQSSAGGGLHVSAVAVDAALRAVATTILMTAAGLVVELAWRSRRSPRSDSRLAPVIGRFAGGD